MKKPTPPGVPVTTTSPTRRRVKAVTCANICGIVKLGDRLHPTGRELIWGPVRHGAGHNIAAYYVEATGAVVELYTDLEQIYDDERPPVVWAQDDNWYNMWSPRRPLDFRDFGIPPAGRH